MSRINDLLSRPILLLIFGAPGSGKGTFGRQLASEFGLKHLVTGDLLRREAQRQSDIGHHIRQAVSQGFHVDDGLICNLIRTEITSRSMGTVLDGTPRTSKQAEFIKSLATSLGLHILGVDLELNRDILVERLLGRRLCVVCNRSYNLCTINRDGYTMDALVPSKRDIERCPGCSNLKQRNDDTREIIEHRLSLYATAHTDVLCSLEEVPIMRFSIRRGLGDYVMFKDQLADFLEDHI